MKWRPIATAPENREILVHMLDDGQSWVMVGSFDPTYGLVDHLEHTQITEAATHWMPLPKKPRITRNRTYWPANP